MELDFAGFEVFDGHGGEAFDVDEPLAFESGFDDSAAFVTVSDGVNDFFFAAEETLFLEVVEDFFATFGGSEAFVVGAGGGEHFAVFADDLDALEVMTLADFKVVEIVGGGNFNGAGAVSGVGVFVGDNRDEAVGEGEFDEAADKVGVAGVGRVDGNSDVAEEGFGSGGRDDDFGRKFLRINSDRFSRATHSSARLYGALILRVKL